MAAAVACPTTQPACCELSCGWMAACRHAAAAAPQVGRVLGTGSFGRVSLARHRATGLVCAIKALSKAHIVKNQQVAAGWRWLRLENMCCSNDGLAAQALQKSTLQVLHILQPSASARAIACIT